MKKKTENKLLKGVDKLVTYKQLIYGLIIGLIIGLFIMVITKEEQIAKLENGEEPVVTFNDKTITANDLYEDMKEYYSVGILLNTIDDMLFRDKYLDEGTVKKEVDDTISQYKEYYKDKFTTLLTQNGFTSEKSFRDYLLLDYRRNEAVNDYMKNHVTESEINKYYEDNVYGDVDTKHILVKPDTKSDMKEDEIKAKKEEANSLAKKIITELNNGKTFDEVKEEYKDSIVYEELGYRPYNDSLEKNYLEEMHKLKVNTYSKTPVESSYGYHIVYKIAQKEKPSLEDVKSDILDTLYEQKIQENSKLYTETLFKIREKNELKFEDSVLREKYETYKTNTLKKA